MSCLGRSPADQESLAMPPQRPNNYCAWGEAPGAFYSETSFSAEHSVRACVKWQQGPCFGTHFEDFFNIDGSSSGLGRGVWCDAKYAYVEAFNIPKQRLVLESRTPGAILAQRVLSSIRLVW